MYIQLCSFNYRSIIASTLTKYWYRCFHANLLRSSCSHTNIYTQSFLITLPCMIQFNSLCICILGSVSISLLVLLSPVRWAGQKGRCLNFTVRLPMLLTCCWSSLGNSMARNCPKVIWTTHRRPLMKGTDLTYKSDSVETVTKDTVYTLAVFNVLNR